MLGLGDILLFCNHASTFIEAKEAWDKRKERFNYEKYVIMMSERDGCTYQDLKAFDNISHKYKVVFVHKNMPEISCAVHLPGTEIVGGGVEHKIKSLTNYIGRFTGRRLIDEYDYVGFLNNCVIDKNKQKNRC